MKDLLSRITGKKSCRQLQAGNSALVSQYRVFSILLTHNETALKAMADLEYLYYSGKAFSLSSARITYETLLESVMGVIYSFCTLTGDDGEVLIRTAEEIDRVLFENFNPKCTITLRHFVLPFQEISLDMKKLVGSKAANLAVINTAMGVPAPPGFAVTSYGFEKYISDNGLDRFIREELSLIDPEKSESIERASASIKTRILDGSLPPELEAAILREYRDLESGAGKGARVSVRSSAAGEDSETTFAGQYETVLNVDGDHITDAYKRVIASKYGVHAINYRMQYGIDDRETPMSVAVVVMVDASASGVLYTADPGNAAVSRISCLWGLGEYLVGGAASPDTFLVNRADGSVIEEHIARKKLRLVSSETVGTHVEPVDPLLQDSPSLQQEEMRQLVRYGMMLEEFFGGPQDIEWVLDNRNRLFILQARPLAVMLEGDEAFDQKEFPGHPVIFSGGSPASSGIAAGKAFVVTDMHTLSEVPRDSIVIARTASAELAAVAGVVRGIITDIGSAASHLASVAREFGIPALFDTRTATTLIATGDLITLNAGAGMVYQGLVDNLLQHSRPQKKLIYESPAHLRLRGILDMISPLNLTGTGSPLFSQEGCRTFHDIIRYTHEYGVRAMFGISGTAASLSGGPNVSVRLSTQLPLEVRIIDLGEGLHEGLSTCDRITTGHVRSLPFKALFAGFTHPGVNWAGTMAAGRNSILRLVALTATSELGEVSDGESYALITQEYMNISIKFAYHFATIDALCSKNPSQNYVSLHFSGGAGSIAGKTLRVHLMADILGRIGFAVVATGDLLKATLFREDRETTEEKIRLLGILLASCRLMDMILSRQDDVAFFVDRFFSGNYDFLSGRDEPVFPQFYLNGGRWKRAEDGGDAVCIQDGSSWGRSLSAGISGMIGKVVGEPYWEFLENIGAYYYFPLAVARETVLAARAAEPAFPVSVSMKLAGGGLDRTGGLVFALTNIDTYCVFSLDAQKGRVSLYAFANSRRRLLAGVRKKIESGKWYAMRITLSGKLVQCFCDDELVISRAADMPSIGGIGGGIGLWTKADSVVWFKDLRIGSGGEQKVVPFD